MSLKCLLLYRNKPDKSRSLWVNLEVLPRIDDHINVLDNCYIVKKITHNITETSIYYNIFCDIEE